MTDVLKRVRVWPGGLRLTHWLIGLTTLALLLTGWLLNTGWVLSERLHGFLLEQVHLPAGYLLAVALVGRCYFLLTDKGVGGYRALLPSRANWPAVKAGLLFYTSFGRLAQPRYFSHPPLWAPVYLAWILVLVWLVATGLLLEFAGLRSLFGWSSLRLLAWHITPLTAMLMLTSLHLFSVALDDLKGVGSNISGMINGYRLFDIGAGGHDQNLKAPRAVHLQDLEGWRGKPGERE